MEPVVEPAAAPVAPPQVESTKPAAAPAPAAAAAPEAKGDAIPDEILRLPAMQAVFAGQPPAVSAPLKDFQKRPEAKLIAQHKDALMSAGLGLYRSLSGDLGVIFNQLKLNPEQLIAADKAGKLSEIAPPFDQVSQLISKSGKNNPVLSVEGVPNAPQPAPTPEVPQAAQMPQPAPASVQEQAALGRKAALTQNSPTSGPRPGAGRLLNSIFKPVI